MPISTKPPSRPAFSACANSHRDKFNERPRGLHASMPIAHMRQISLSSNEFESHLEHKATIWAIFEDVSAPDGQG